MVIKDNNSWTNEMDVLENKVSAKFTANPSTENWIIYFPNGWATLPGFRFHLCGQMILVSKIRNFF